MAIEIDDGTASSTTTVAAQDCVVFPQRIGAGIGAMKFPTALSDSGIVALGNRKLGTASRGVFVPPLQEASGVLPLITGSAAGYLVFDTTGSTLRIWDGGTPGRWLTVQAT
jgi:hypothetical protein